jgi:hypothetical protein
VFIRRYDEAVSALNRAEELAPGSGTIRMILGIALLGKGPHSKTRPSSCIEVHSVSAIWVTPALSRANPKPPRA